MVGGLIEIDLNKGTTSEFVGIQLEKFLNGTVETLACTLKGAPQSELELMKFMNDNLIGQDGPKLDMVHKISQRLLNKFRDGGLLGLFVLSGVQGVGKTEIGKVLCEYLLGDPDALNIIECGQFKEQHTASRLIGSPPGFLGHGAECIFSASNLFEGFNNAKEKGLLHESIAHLDDFAIILFDEYAEMNENIFQTLLTAIEEGKIRLANGKVVSLKNCIFLFAGNLGHEKIQKAEKGDSMGFGNNKGKGASNKELKKIYNKEYEDFFSSAFRDRVTAHYIFNRLDDKELAFVLRKHLIKLNKHNILKDNGIEVALSRKLVDFMISKVNETDGNVRPLVSSFKDIIQPFVSQILDLNETKSLLDSNRYFKIEISVNDDGELIYEIYRKRKAVVKKEILKTATKLKANLTTEIGKGSVTLNSLKILNEYVIRLATLSTRRILTQDEVDEIVLLKDELVALGMLRSELDKFDDGISLDKFIEDYAYAIETYNGMNLFEGFSELGYSKVEWKTLKFKLKYFLEKNIGKRKVMEVSYLMDLFKKSQEFAIGELDNHNVGETFDICLYNLIDEILKDQLGYEAYKVESIELIKDKDSVEGKLIMNQLRIDENGRVLVYIKDDYQFDMQGEISKEMLLRARTKVLKAISNK